jgi:hypothetical protein
MALIIDAAWGVTMGVRRDSHRELWGVCRESTFY